MSGTVKMDQAEYMMMEEEAKKVLETLDQESIDQLRESCSSSLKSITNYLSGKVNDANRVIGNTGDINPFRTAKIKFWLGQIANFISVALFKVPSELTPSYQYPHSSKEQERAYENDYSKLSSMLERARFFYATSRDYFNEIYKNISEDDTKLMMLCISCANLNNGKSEMPVSSHFKQTATLLYQNNSILLCSLQGL